MVNPPTLNHPERLLSLDAFRGFTIAGMILVNNPGSWSHIYPPLHHAEWHGWTFTDLIFPFFLFIVGVAIPFSLTKRLERGDPKQALFLRILRRAVLLFALGLFLHGFPKYDFSTIRIPGVLQRIAVCYLVASVVFMQTRLTGQVVFTAALLIVYWLLMKLIPVPGYGAGILEREGNFAAYIDQLFLEGHMWSATKTWDPEGIVSTIPAIATTMFGIFTGLWLRAERSQIEKGAWIFVAGNVCLIVGSVMDIWLPINKNLWTSSYSVFMAGMALNGLGLLYWTMDIHEYRRWGTPFIIYGRNAIAVFVLSSLAARITTLVQIPLEDGSEITLKTYIYQNFFLTWLSPIDASLAFALSYVLFWLALMFILFRYKIFVTI